MRQAFNFYSSYDEVILDLDDVQLPLFVRALLDIQFFRKHIDNISFIDKVLSMAWKASKHSIKKQLEGYCNANKIDYNSLFDETKPAYEAPYEGTIEAPLKPASLQGQGQGQEEVVITHSKKACRIENQSEENKSNLDLYMTQYCKDKNISVVEIEKFTDYWKAASGKTAIKRDWKATFRNWCRNDWVIKDKKLKKTEDFLI